MFSPYYALARRMRKTADPMDHCALNVALYGAGGKRWVLTERGRRGVSRSSAEFHIGPSALRWSGGTLTIEIDELTMPVPRRVRGTVTVRAPFLVGQAFALDAAGRHSWQPIAPCARVEVEMERPALSWSGTGYLDHNAGTEPLESSFARWDWSRAAHSDGASILYDVTRRDGGDHLIALEIDRAGRVLPLDDVPDRGSLPPTGIWRVPRNTRSESGSTPRVVETLEDTPFYARSIIETGLGGRRLTAVHESLSLDRFKQPVVQMMLPFKTLRLAR